MKNILGQYVKGHKVLDEWKEKSSIANKDKPNVKNSIRIRTNEELNRLKKHGFQKGFNPHNKDNGRIKFNCIICGEEVFDKPYRRKKTCSYKCRTELSHILRGVNHWNYKGENNYLQRQWSEYREWRTKVFERDNYTCQSCGKKGGNLNAHHIQNFANYLELRFEISNGITLCKDCHLYVIHRRKRAI